MSERSEEHETIQELVEHSPFTNQVPLNRDETFINTHQNDTTENNNEIISDLKGLVNILNDGKRRL